MTVEEQLRRAADELQLRVQDASIPALPFRPRHGRRRVALAVGAAVSILVLALGVASVASNSKGNDRIGVSATDTSGPARPRSDEPPPIPGGATALTRGPLAARGDHSVIWTGTEMIVWGGWGDELGRIKFSDGAAYNPTTDRWRLLPRAPLSARGGHIAAWTGKKVLVVGGDNNADAAAYEPETDRWRPLPPAPFGIGVTSSNAATPAAWTGKRLAVWSPDTDRVALFDPTTDEWTLTPGPGLHDRYPMLLASKDYLFALGSTASDTRYRKMGEQTWLAPEGPSPDLAVRQSNAAVLDDQLLAWEAGPAPGAAASFDPTSGTWTALPNIPLEGCESPGDALPFPTWGVSPQNQDRAKQGQLLSRLLVFDPCGSAVILNWHDRSWTRTELENARGGRYAVVAGDEVLNWGATPWRWRIA